MRQQHVGDALGRPFPSAFPGRVAAQERIDQDLCVARIDAKGRVAVPGQFHVIVSSISGCREDRTRTSDVKRKLPDLPVITARRCRCRPSQGGKTLAGLDLGDKTIGVAVSDRGPVLRASAPGHPAEEVLARCREPAGPAGQGECRGGGHRPADQHGRLGGSAGAGVARLRPQHGEAHRPALPVLGRAPVDGGGRAHADRDGFFTQEARRARSIRLRPPSSCRACSTGFTRSARTRRRNSGRATCAPWPAGCGAAGTPRSPAASTVSSTQALATSGGMVAGIDPQHVSIELEEQVVKVARHQDVAEIHVVERQVEPAPENAHRQGPQNQEPAHLQLPSDAPEAQSPASIAAASMVGR